MSSSSRRGQNPDPFLPDLEAGNTSMLRETTPQESDTAGNLSSTETQLAAPASGEAQGSGNESGNEQEKTKRKESCCSLEEKKKKKEQETYSKLMELLDQAEEGRGWKAWFWMGVEVVVVLGLTAALICSLLLEQLNHKRLLKLRVWQYVTMAGALFGALSLIRFLTWLLLLLMSKCKCRLHRDLSYFAREMKSSIDVTLWLFSISTAWYLWFRPRLRHVYGDVSVVVSHQLTRLLIALCIGSVLWVGKNALFCWLEADLHYRQLCNRITRTIRQFHVLQILIHLGVWKFLTPPKYKNELQKLLKLQPSPEEKVTHLRMKGHNICKEMLFVNRDTVPVWILRRLCDEYSKQMQTRPLPLTKDIVQEPEKLMKLALKLFSEMKASKKSKNDSNTTDVSDDSEDDEVNIKVLENRYQVTRDGLEMFFKIFEYFSHGKWSDTNKYGRIYDHKNEADNSSEGHQASRWCCFGGNNKWPEGCIGRDEFCSWTDHQASGWCCFGGKNHSQEGKNDYDDGSLKDYIGRDEFCSWAVTAYRNCWGLQSTLKSSEQIILKLNRMMMGFVVLLVVIIWLLLTEIVDTAQIALLFSPLLAAKFIFSESTKNMFDGLIFALAMHPFNPGDHVIIQGMELLVTEVNILTTTFYKYQTKEELIYPNSELATTPVINLENIPDQSDYLEFRIDKNTPPEDIRDLEVKVQMELDKREDAFKTKVVKTEMLLSEIKMLAHFNYVGSYLTSEAKAVHKSEMLSTILRLVKLQKDEKELKLVAPPTSKPYVVDITFEKTVKCNQLETIKNCVERTLKAFYDEEYNFKVVFNNVDKRKIWVAFYVWKKSLLSTDEKKEQTGMELAGDLDSLSKDILERLQAKGISGGSSSGTPQQVASSSNNNTSNNAGHQPGLKVSTVEFQLPAFGIAQIKNPVDVDEEEELQARIKGHFSKKYERCHFEVKINQGKELIIYARRKFPDNIEEGNQQFDLKLKLKELKKFRGDLKTPEDLTPTGHRG